MNELEDYGALRVLIVGGKSHAVQILRQVMGILGIRRIHVVASPADAIDRLRTQSFSAVFCDESAAHLDRDSFGRAARQSAGVLNPMIPIFLVCSGPRRRDIEAARDLGFTDVLARPVSASTIMRKLKLAIFNPRPFIAAGEFFGPDRRSPKRVNFHGDDKRKRKPRQVKVGAPTAGDKVFI